MRSYSPVSRVKPVSFWRRLSGKYLKSEYRVLILFWFVALLFVVITVQMFKLQIVKYYYYNKLSNHARKVILPAKRGEILGQDYFNGKYYTWATNTSYDLFYVDPDPRLLRDKAGATQAVTPFVFKMLCGDLGKVDVKFELDVRRSCAKNVNNYARLDKKMTEVEILGLDKTWDRDKYYRRLSGAILARMNKIYITRTVLQVAPQPEVVAKINLLKLSGVYANKLVIYVNPQEIKEPSVVAEHLAPILHDKDQERLSYLLTSRKSHYAPIARKIPKDFSFKVREMKKGNKDYAGFVLVPEPWREYPEGNLASQVLGYVNKDFVPQYGIEEYWNEDIRGKDGEIVADTDVGARQVSFNNSVIKQAINGKNVVITINRIIQRKIEKLLQEQVDEFKARSGQVIAINPKNGDVIAMAQYPSFDPNFFNEVLTTKIVDEDPKTRGQILAEFSRVENKLVDVRNLETGEVTKVSQDVTVPTYEVYKNFLGVGSYYNNVVSSIYEPGSVIKPLTISAGIDIGELKPQTKSEYTQALEINEFISDKTKKIVIHNDSDKYSGRETMTQILEHSSNVGTAWVADRIGKSLLYDYLIHFGFNIKAGVALPKEISGKITNWHKWSRTEMITSAFGQGMSATPLQVVMAYVAMANGGELLKPRLVKKIIDSVTGQEQVFEREVVRRVIKPSTSRTISAMLTSSVKNGVAHRGAVKGYNVAGKTGTSQIPRSDGPGYEDGKGTTIASFVGYVPSDDPKFVLLVKIDRPLANPYGSRVAAPLFSRIAKYMLSYYGIARTVSLTD